MKIKYRYASLVLVTALPLTLWSAPASKLVLNQAAPSFAIQSTDKGKNLCYNSAFENAENPFDGWMTDYAWTGNTHYLDNKSRITYLPGYAGRQNVMHINGKSAETMVECQPIPFESGARYRCTITYKSTLPPHVYFTGYKWKPGIRPYHDKQIHLGDLRKIYKGTFRDHKISTQAGDWKTETFDFPEENASELSLKHLKAVRFFTIYFIVTDDARGEAWIDNVIVTRIK